MKVSSGSRVLPLVGMLMVVLSARLPAWAGDDSKADETPEQKIARSLDESWPDHPEWLDMFSDILQGSTLGPGEGWFRKAVAQTRFDWKSVASRLDTNADGQIARKEFVGSDGDFARLDRDGNGVLTSSDFDFSPHALSPSVGSSVMRAADADSDGKVSRAEIAAFFDRCDSGGMGFLSQNDLQNAFRPPPMPAADAPPPAEPSKETLIRGLFRQEIGSLQPGPAVGENAPNFTLKTNDGKLEVRLADLKGEKPIVLVFGNFTCGPFRNQGGNVEKLYRMYKDRAHFVMIYVREAHPTDGWTMESNDRAGVSIPQPRTYDERAAVARSCGARLNLGFPMVVDTIDDAVGAPYSGMPSRLYLIDRDGRVAYKSGRGPFGFKPAELEQSLLLLLQEHASPARGATKP